MEIIYQDESLLLVNKPAGLLTIRDGYDASLPNLVDMVRQDFDKCWVVHRLDKETSGLVLFALTAGAHRNLNIQFQDRKVKKEYRALVLGKVEAEEFAINAPLRVNGDRMHRSTIDFTNGKPALTKFYALRLFKLVSYVKAIPKSGYTHQIRAHLAYAGHPILGDALYIRKDLGFSPMEPTPIARVALHAYQLSFSHPITGETLTFQVDPPIDFQSALSSLK